MINSEVSQAIKVFLWISEECPGCLPQQVGIEQYGALQLVMDIDTEEMYRSWIVAVGEEMGRQLCLWYAEVEMYESAAKIARAVNNM